MVMWFTWSSQCVYLGSSQYIYLGFCLYLIFLPTQDLAVSELKTKKESLALQSRKANVRLF